MQPVRGRRSEDFGEIDIDETLNDKAEPSTVEMIPSDFDRRRMHMQMVSLNGNTATLSSIQIGRTSLGGKNNLKKVGAWSFVSPFA